MTFSALLNTKAKEKFVDVTMQKFYKAINSNK